jgi:hypothetical protein
VAVIESTSDAQGDHPVTYLGQFGVKPQQVLRKRKASAGPRAETDTRYIMMGIDLDLDRAMRLAVQEVVNFLVAEKGLEPVTPIHSRVSRSTSPSARPWIRRRSSPARSRNRSSSRRAAIAIAISCRPRS